MKVAVLGSGAGALAVAADMSRHGRHTVMADLDDERADDLDGERANERAGLESVRAAGSITVTVTGYGDGEGDGGDDGDDGDGDQHGEGDGGESDQRGDGGDDGDGGESDQHGDGTSGRQASTHPVDVADSVAEALAGAELAVVVVPCGARERWVRAIAPHTTPDHTVLLIGEGGGAIVARRAIEPPTVVAETNMLPHRAHATGPGTVDVTAKRGGVLVASLPATPPDTARVMELIGDVWPQAAATDTVWTTVLTSYDAIEAAAADVTAAQAAVDVTAAQAVDVTAVQAAADVTAAQAVDATAAQAVDVAAAAAADAIDAADAELRALRLALFSRESRGYHDFRMAQGLTPDSTPPTPGHAATSDRPTTPGRPTTPDRPTTPGHAGAEDLPGALVLASSLGRAAGVPTPAIDALVSGALARLGRDLTDGPPTLAALGLGGLDVTGLIGFARSGLFP